MTQDIQTASTVRVVARVQVRPDQIEPARALLTSILQPTRAEPGCLDYRLHQNTDDPAEFTFIEEWASDGAIDAHFAQPHLQQALGAVQPMLAAAPDIRRYRRIA